MRFGTFRLQAVLVVVVMLLVGQSARFDASVHQGKQPNSKCPVLKLTCPDLVNVGASLAFVVNLSGGDPNVTPTFNWSVSSGAISSGQGTVRVEVDTNGLSDGETVTATVEAGGFERECSTFASCTASVMKKPEARKVDEYTTLKPKDEEARLDNFVIELQREPTMQGYVIAYSGAASRAGGKPADKAKDYLVNKRSIDPSRIVRIAGGSREQATVELWIVPMGAESPKATPTVDSTKGKLPSPAKPRKP